jgi:prepilin-type N-terminal cleavage/methylation domain-containing protein
LKTWIKSLRSPSAFTLIELIVVLALIGGLFAITAPVVGLQITRSRVATEMSSLQNMAAAVQASFESTDLEGTNIAALSGSVPAGVDTTNFSPSTSPTYIPSTINNFDWYVKIARQLGYSLQNFAFPASAVPAPAATVLYNANQNTRCMLIGPATESASQRFLIVSLIGSPAQLAIPPLPNPSNPQDPANLALFNDLWNTNWATTTGSLPATWIAALTAAQAQAWQGRMWQLCVQRVVCPKLTITVNNTDPTLSCYVYYNFNGSTAANSIVVPANGGSQTIATPIYYGRLIQAWRGTAPPPDPSATLFSQFVLRANSEITLQD